MHYVAPPEKPKKLVGTGTANGPGHMAFTTVPEPTVEVFTQWMPTAQWVHGEGLVIQQPDAEVTPDD